MNKQTGFTLIELMVSLTIIGILSVTCILVYHTWLQRAYGQEATLMVKQILDGQIIHYLDKNYFYPEEVSESIFIPDSDDAATQQNIANVLNAINVTIPPDHNLEYQLTSYGDYFQVTVTANFALFKGGYNRLIGNIDRSGEIIVLPAQVGE